MRTYHWCRNNDEKSAEIFKARASFHSIISMWTRLAVPLLVCCSWIVWTNPVLIFWYSADLASRSYPSETRLWQSSHNLLLLLDSVRCLVVCASSGCIVCFRGFAAKLRAMASSFTRFLDHTQRRATVGRIPLDEWSARRRDLYLTTHNTQNRQTSMPSVGFELTISAGVRPQTYALDGAATGTGSGCIVYTILRKLL
jgi:hypothetical protein